MRGTVTTVALSGASAQARFFSAAMWVVISASEVNRQFQYFWDKFDDQRIFGVIKDHNLY